MTSQFSHLSFSNYPILISVLVLVLSLVWDFSRVLRDTTPRFVRRSVGWSVTLYFFYVFLFFDHTAPAQILWWPQIWPLPTNTRLRYLQFVHQVGHPKELISVERNHRIVTRALGRPTCPLRIIRCVENWISKSPEHLKLDVQAATF